MSIHVVCLRWCGILIGLCRNFLLEHFVKQVIGVLFLAVLVSWFAPPPTHPQAGRCYGDPLGACELGQAWRGVLGWHRESERLEQVVRLEPGSPVCCDLENKSYEKWVLLDWRAHQLMQSRKIRTRWAYGMPRGRHPPSPYGCKSAGAAARTWRLSGTRRPPQAPFWCFGSTYQSNLHPARHSEKTRTSL